MADIQNLNLKLKMLRRIACSLETNAKHSIACSLETNVKNLIACSLEKI